MTSVIESECLLWKDVAGGSDYHAALTVLSGGDRTLWHHHDFHEVMLVLDGVGTHVINGADVIMRPRDLIFVRPQDAHTIVTRSTHKLQFMNIAWRSSLWWEFGEFAKVTNILTAWENGRDPVSARVEKEEFGACRGAFDEILSAYNFGIHAGAERGAFASRLEVAPFFSALLLLLAGVEHGTTKYQMPLAGGANAKPAGEWPLWLKQACRAMKGNDLSAGLPRFVELSGVSYEHLGRNLKKYADQTPTEWINSRRLEQAAVLLATTSDAVSDIAYDCGFTNMAHFHRLFREKYGLSPRTYRLAAGRLVVQ